MLALSLKRRLAALGVAMFALTAAPSARALPAQIAVFLNSTQKIPDYSDPKLSLFAFFYSRPGVDVLGVYAGPRWTLGKFGIEFKTGAYGGGDNYPMKAILNNQLDFTLKHLSLTSFTDWYPPTQMYSYLSGFLVFGPLYVGAVSDVTRDWSSQSFTTLQGGPSVGLGTKGLYLGVAYIFRNDDTQAIRMTVGISL